MKGLARLMLAAALVLSLGACHASPAVPAPTPPPGTAAGSLPAPHDLAPDFTLATSDGKVIQLSALRGRWVLVNFWATWCAPCREEMPYLDSLATQHADRLTVLAVNMREPRQDVAAFVAELDLQLPVLLAPDDATLLAYAVRGLPVSFLVAPDGVIARRVVGPVPPGVIEDFIAPP